MKPILPLTTMTQEEKLRALQELWDDLTQSEKEFPSPGWHGEILRDREKLLAEGRENFLSLDHAKQTIRLRYR